MMENDVAQSRQKFLKGFFKSRRKYLSFGLALILIFLIILYLVPFGGLERFGFIAQKKEKEQPSSAASTVSPLIFGTNLGLYDASDQFLTSAATRQQMKNIHISLVRMPIRAVGCPSTWEVQAAQYIHDLGMSPIVILKFSQTDPTTAAKCVIQQMNNIYGNSVVYYEFGNERDINGVDQTTYTNTWNQVISQVKSTVINGKFVGPVNGYPNTSYIAYFVNNANPAPDYVSYHQYTCSSSSTAPDCLSKIPTYATHLNEIKTAIAQTGKPVPPIMLTEWNYDPVPPNPDSRVTASFEQQYTQAMLSELANDGFFAATHYVVTGSGGYQLIDSSGNLTPEGQTFGQMYDSLNTTPIPSPDVSPTPSPIPPTPKPTPTPIPTPTSTPIPVDSIAPTVSITAPTDGSTVSGGVNVAANASDNVGVTKVEFYVDAVLKVADTTSPYGFGWDTNTVSVPNGAHAILAKAYNAAGNTASDSVTVTVQNGDITPPSAPTNLVATAAAYNKVNLNWTASTDNVGVTGYWIIRGGVNIASSSTNSYSDTIVSPKTPYSYQVIAYDAAQNHSASSNTATVTTPDIPDTQAPTAPANLTASAVSSSQINLAWTASTDNISVTGYEVYRANTRAATVTTTSFGDTGLLPSTSYSYYVKAKDAAGNLSLASNTVSAATSALPVYGSITGTVTSSSGSPIVGATVYTTVSGTRKTSTTNSSGVYNLVNLPAGTYSLMVSAKRYTGQTLSVTVTSGNTTTKNVTLQGKGNKR